jgi:hypothetical protein
MPYWLQNLCVLLAVLACAAFIVRAGVRALRGKKSNLAGCGTCTGCAPPPADSNSPAHPSTQSPKSERLVFLPADLLAQRHSARKRGS